MKKGRSHMRKVLLKVKAEMKEIKRKHHTTKPEISVKKYTLPKMSNGKVVNATEMKDQG